MGKIDNYWHQLEFQKIAIQCAHGGHSSRKYKRRGRKLSKSFTAGSTILLEKPADISTSRLQAVLWNTKVHQRVQVISPSTETSSHHYHSANVPYSFIYHQEEGKRNRQRPQLHRRFLTQPDEQKEHTKIEYSLTRTAEENEWKGQETENTGLSSNVSDFYSWGVLYESRPIHWPPWGPFVVFLSPSREMLEKRLIICHDRFLSHPFIFILYHHHTTRHSVSRSQLQKASLNITKQCQNTTIQP
jgi:hypothetical protein